MALRCSRIKRYRIMPGNNRDGQWRSEGPAGPVTAGGGGEGPARGPPGRSSRRKPFARGPNKLFAGAENRRYATGDGTHGDYPRHP